MLLPFYFSEAGGYGNEYGEMGTGEISKYDLDFALSPLISIKFPISMPSLSTKEYVHS